MANSTERPPHTVTDKREQFTMVYASAFAKWREPGTKLTPVCMMVYLALGFRADFAQGTCFPSIDVIAKEAGCSRRSAIDALKTLEAEGIISVEARYRDEGRQTSNLYTLLDTGKNLHPKAQSGRGAKNNTPRGAKSDTPGGGQNLHPNNTHNEPDTPTKTKGAKAPTKSRGDKGAEIKPDDIRVYRLVDAYGKASNQHVAKGRSRSDAKSAFKDLPKSITPEDIAGCVAWMQGDPYYDRPGAMKPDRVAMVVTDWIKRGRPASYSSGTSPNGTAHTDEEQVDYTAGMEDWGGVEISRHVND